MILLRMLFLCAILLYPITSEAGVFTGRIEEGAKLYETGDYKGALEKFQEFEIDNPEGAAAKYNQANSYYQLGKNREAEKQYRNVVEEDLQKGDIKSLYNLGSTLYQEGRLHQAAGAFQKVLEIAPGDEDATYNLELIKKRIAQSKQAENQEKQEGDKQQGEDGEKSQDGEKGDQQGENSQNGEKSQSEGDQQKPGEEDSQSAGEQGNEDSPEEDNIAAGDDGEDEKDKPMEGDISAAGEESDKEPEDNGSSASAGKVGQGQTEGGIIGAEDVKRLLGSIKEGKIVRPGGRRQGRLKKDW